MGSDSHANIYHSIDCFSGCGEEPWDCAATAEQHDPGSQQREDLPVSSVQGTRSHKAG